MAEPRPADDVASIIETLRRHHYEFRGKIGEGGHATVFSAWSQQYSELFVVKKIPVKPTQEITSEVQLLMNLQHPNIINMYDFWCEENNLYVILEYCPNGSLKDFIKARGPLNPHWLHQAYLEIASAIEFCHANNVVHRDIKPANLLIDKYHRIKLADFGISVHADAQIKSVLGSPAYLSPEILSGRSDIDYFRNDIWALGVTLFELSAGVLPWSSTTFREMRHEILVGLQARPPVEDYSFLKLLTAMMDNNPLCRPSITRVLRSDYLSQKMPSVLPRRFARARELKMSTGPTVRGFDQPDAGENPIALRDLANSPLALKCHGFTRSQTIMQPVRRYPKVAFRQHASIGNMAQHKAPLSGLEESDSH